jgi:hypothetical protein
MKPIFPLGSSEKRRVRSVTRYSWLCAIIAVNFIVAAIMSMHNSGGVDVTVYCVIGAVVSLVWAWNAGKSYWHPFRNLYHANGD